MLQELQRDGAVQGIGKAELLRKIKGMSKRIDDTNRLVYTAEMTTLSFCHAGGIMRIDWRENHVSKSDADRLRAGA